MITVSFYTFFSVYTLCYLIVSIPAAVRSAEPVKKAFSGAFLCIALLTVLRFTLFPVLFYGEGVLPMTLTAPLFFKRASFVPFRSICRSFHSRPMFLYNTVGNLLLFLPFGCALPAALRGMRRFHRTLLAGAALSFIIEAVQYFIPDRRCDIDDLILNVLGTALGCLLYGVARRALETAKRVLGNVPSRRNRYISASGE